MLTPIEFHQTLTPFGVALLAVVALLGAFVCFILIRLAFRKMRRLG